MTCSDCGHPVTGADNFCQNCGRAVSNRPPVAAPASPYPGGVLVSWRGGQVALGIVLVLVSFAAVFLLSEALVRLAGGYRLALAAWERSHLMGFAIIVIVWLLGLRPGNLPLGSLGLRFPAVSHLRYTALTIAAFGASIGSNVAYVALVQFLGLDILTPPKIPEEITFPGPGILLTFQALALWTPFTEEVFFRGFVFAGLIPRLGVGLAVVVSAIVFSLFHVDPRVMLPIFVTGALLAWLYHLTGSLWPSIAVHAGQNALAVATTLLGGWTIAGA